MIRLELGAAPPVEIVENVASGNGYWYAIPAELSNGNVGFEAVHNFGTFIELPKILEAAQSHGSVVVEGAPGSGKSHLVREIQTGCVLSDVPCFCLTTHVNASKASGAEVAATQLDSFRKAAGDIGVVIVDNVDFIGYRGSSRTRRASTMYAQGIEPLLADLVQDPSLLVIATAHNDMWRAARWKWNDPNIDGPAERIMQNFGSRVVFEGFMSLVGLAHIMKDRGYGLGDSARTIRLLSALGRANFFHANHIDPGSFLRDPESAIAAIEAGRQERIG